MRCIAVTALLLSIAPAAAPAATRIGAAPPSRGAPGIAIDHTWTRVEPPPRAMPDNASARGSYGGEARQLRRQIERARDNGWISRCGARQFRREVGRLQYHGAIYGADGFSGFETRVLDARALYLRGLINAPVNLAGSAGEGGC